jgi:nucleoprotein TPR
MASADVEVGFLAAHLGLPELTLTTAVSDPTTELVRSILQAVTVRAHEFNDLSSERLTQGIELENVIRSSEARTQSFKSTAEQALKDVEELRQKLKSEGEYP